MSESGRTPHASQLIPDSVEARARARLIVASGGLIAFRTDTFYGLGADPFNPQAVGRINKLKEREGRKPVLVVVSEAETGDRFLSETTDLFQQLSARYWPGPLTIIGRARPLVPDEITAGTKTVGLRLPADEEAREVIRAAGGALTATSANLAGQAPARTALEVKNYFPSELDLILDGGAARTDKPSTVIDVSRGGARLVREGEITRERLAQTLSSLGEELE
jgi:L-threonylcarbamoyladenylate synthase